MTKAVSVITKASNSGQWELIPKAAERLGIHPGHLRRQCKEKFIHDGRAKLVRGGGKKSRYMVRLSDRDLPELVSDVIASAAPSQSSPGDIAVRASSAAGDIAVTASPPSGAGDTIMIEVMHGGVPCFRMTIPATAGDRREALEPSSKGVRRAK